ncbi:cytochrome b [Paracoccaceae bacterium Fryx2]|nr:cytochrome b [Paracoccaceae bacterium Fryx2]
MSLPAYRPTARALHWMVAILLLATIPAGAVMVQEGLPRWLQNTLFIFHKNIGVVILFLVVLRLAFRATFPPPPMPDSVPTLQQKIARLTHAILYVLLIVMAVSGYVRVTAGGFPLEALDALMVPRPLPKSDAVAEVAKSIHFYTRFALIGVILLHILAALFHGFVRKDGVFSRMWPSSGR